MKLVRILALAFVTALARPAAAEWTKAETHEFSVKTRVKIVDPSYGKTIVTIGSDTKEKPLPAIFTCPGRGPYVALKIVESDGDTWSGKVEVRATSRRWSTSPTHTTAPPSTPAATPTSSSAASKLYEPWRANDRADKS